MVLYIFGCTAHLRDYDSTWLCPFAHRYLMSLRGHVASVYQIAWSADSRLLVSGSSDSTLKVWDIKSGKLNMDLPGHADEVGEGNLI